MPSEERESFFIALFIRNLCQIVDEKGRNRLSSTSLIEEGGIGTSPFLVWRQINLFIHVSISSYHPPEGRGGGRNVVLAAEKNGMLSLFASKH